MKLTDEIADVQTRLDALLTRCEEIAEQRRAQGKSLGAGAREALADLADRIEALRRLADAEPEPPDPDDQVAAELRALRDRYYGGAK